MLSAYCFSNAILDSAVLILAHTEYKLYFVCTNHTLSWMCVRFINKDLGPQFLVLAIFCMHCSVSVMHHITPVATGVRVK